MRPLEGRNLFLYGIGGAGFSGYALLAHEWGARVRGWDRVRTPYLAPLEERGLEVVIAGAGLAAHLPGVVAAHTTLPVIGVPLTSARSVAGGLDALLSIAQMPPGVPVACVGVDNPRNAAVLAARILS